MIFWKFFLMISNFDFHSPVKKKVDLQSSEWIFWKTNPKLLNQKIDFCYDF